MKDYAQRMMVRKTKHFFNAIEGTTARAFYGLWPQNASDGSNYRFVAQYIKHAPQGAAIPLVAGAAALFDGVAPPLAGAAQPPKPLAYTRRAAAQAGQYCC